MKDSMIKKIAMIVIFIAALILGLLNIDLIVKGALIIVIMIATMILGFSKSDLNSVK